jgi:folate-binding protein YgfZ
MPRRLAQHIRLCSSSIDQQLRKAKAAQYSGATGRVIIGAGKPTDNSIGQEGVIVSRFACYLTDDALIHLRGTNIAGFLQGQLSCDTRRLGERKAVSGALCNVKGRVISDLTVIQHDSDHCLLRLRASLAEYVAQTLTRYAQFSRISVEVDPRPNRILGIYGNLNPSPIDIPDLPATPLELSTRGELIALRRASAQLELIALEIDAPEPLRPYLESLEPGTAAQWSAATLATGHYALELDDTEQFTPQALNYDLSGLVAFDKGCYTGQEVIARLHYKGQSKRRLQIFTTAINPANLTAGTALFNSASERVGRCLRAAQDMNERCILAAEVNASDLNTTLFLDSSEPLHPIPPAYAV